MGNKKNVPAIRFKGFTEVWNNELLGKLATFSKGCGYSKGDLVENGIPIILYGRLYTKYQTVISDIDTFAIQKKGSIISKGIEVVVPASGETAEDISRASAIVIPNVIIAGDLNIIYPNRELNSVFLALSISNGNAQKNLSKKAQGKSVVHLHNSDLNEIELNHPAVDEQKAIGNFFQNIDSFINTSQAKLDKLKTLKKACLEKMFPRNGSNIPEIRFKGFTKEWVKCDLRDVSTIKTGYPFNSSDFDGNGVYRIITNGNIQDNSAFVDNSTGNKINILDKQIIKDYVLNIGDILVTMDGTVGRTAKVNNLYQVLAQRVGRLISNRSAEFLYQYLNTGEFHSLMTTVSVGGTIKHISLSDIGDFHTIKPTNDSEEYKIGAFLEKLDDLKALTEQKIEKLKNIKKACLDKMFVNRED